MILIDGSRIIIDGTVLEVTAETTALLLSVYRTLKDTFGEEYAKEKLVEMGRIAVMNEEELRGGLQ